MQIPKEGFQKQITEITAENKYIISKKYYFKKEKSPLDVTFAMCLLAFFVCSSNYFRIKTNLHFQLGSRVHYLTNLLLSTKIGILCVLTVSHNKSHTPIIAQKG
jgi:hypothetical protein